MRVEHTNHLPLCPYSQIPLHWQVHAPWSWVHYDSFLLSFPMKIPGKWLPHCWLKLRYCSKFRRQVLWERLQSHKKLRINWGFATMNMTSIITATCCTVVFTTQASFLFVFLIQWQKRVAMTLGLKSNNNKYVAMNFKLPTFSKNVIFHQQDQHWTPKLVKTFLFRKDIKLSILKKM